MSDVLTIKLKPYLQEYLTCKLGDPVTASTRNIVGALMRPLLQYRPKDVDHEFIDGPEYIKINLREFDFIDIRSGTVWMHPDNQAIFEKQLDAHFKDIFMSYMNDKVRYSLLDRKGKVIRNGQIKNIILQFCSDYNITFKSITYEMLKKYYYRKSQEFEKKSPRKMSLLCPLLFL
ncbi:MAG TPA: hypothetical protein PKN21_01260 [Bacteroidales bacterium]|nr:hypothetical protein [Bacteroidales bacterium]